MASASRTRYESGFSLLELIVVMSILAVLAGAAIPVVSKSITRSRITDTRGRLARLESAIQAYFEDTGRFPPRFEDLETNVSDVDGWVGPYLRALTAGAVGPSTDLGKDAWGRAYEVGSSGDSALYLVSLGPDGTLESRAGSSGGSGDLGGAGGSDGNGKGNGNGDGNGKGKGNGKGQGDEHGHGSGDDGGGGGSGSGSDGGASALEVSGDDLAVVIDVTPIRRRQTLAELSLLDAAVAAYNSGHLPDDPLPTKFGALLEVLSDGGYLPSDTSSWQTDGWGDAYLAKPVGSSPPMGVTSTHL